MSTQDRFIYVPIVVALLLQTATACYVFGDDDAIRFDVPALVAVQTIECAEGKHSLSPSQKIIELVIPVSSEVRTDDRNQIDEFRFDVSWNRNVYPIFDYAPKTQTVSDVEGLISVEKDTDRNAGMGINLSSAYLEAVSGSAKINFSNHTGTKLKYQEVPVHEILVASGTIQRGTGAFFRFHPSRRTSLEGGRDLIVAYRVPQAWRGGVVKIECRASGQHKIIGGWHEPLDVSRAFVMPIYLEGDDQARQVAEDFVRSEQGLRINWRRYQEKSSSPAAGLFGLTLTPNANPGLPPQWVHHLIQSGGDEYLKKYRSRLTGELADAADQFVLARRDLLELSR